MSLARHIDTLRAKPRHVRERLALGTAVCVTALVAVAWASVMAASGAFALTPREGSPAFAQVTPTAAEATDTGTNFSQLMGAVGAGIASSTKPALVIEDAGSSSSLARPTAPEATVIPF